MRLTLLLASAGTLLLYSAQSLAVSDKPMQLCGFTLRYDIDIGADGTASLRTQTAAASTVLLAREGLSINDRWVELNRHEYQAVDQYRRGLGLLARRARDLALQASRDAIDRALDMIGAHRGATVDAARLERHLAPVWQLLNQQLDGRHLPARMLGPDYDAALGLAIDHIAIDAATSADGPTPGQSAMALPPAPAMRLLDARAALGGDRLDAHQHALCQQLRQLDAIESRIGRFDAFVRRAASI